MKYLVALVTLCSLPLSASGQTYPGPAPAPEPAPAGPGYYTAPPPPVVAPPASERSGFMAGFGIGLGGMTSEEGPIECIDCNYRPAALGIDMHLGGMLTPRLGLMFEVWGTGVPVEASGSATLVQVMGLLAAQYWVTPRFWIKGGIGFARLDLTVDDGYTTDNINVDEGTAVMGALGYELMSTDRFALDFQFRAGVGTYSTKIQDSISAATIGIGFNWY